VKFGFVAKHRGIWPVALMWGALDVSRGGFYAWLARPRSQRELADEVLGKQVKQSFVDSDRTMVLAGSGTTCGMGNTPVSTSRSCWKNRAFAAA
jgi:hypothetical protein